METGGVVGINGLVVGSASLGGYGVLCCSQVSSEAEPNRQKATLGSAASFKQGRSNGHDEELDWRCLKMARAEPSSLFKPSSHFLSSAEEQMHGSFSKTTAKALLLNSGDAFRGYHQLQASAAEPLPATSAAPYVSAGLEPRSLSGNMQGVLARVKWPFTPSQWMELEHQALIYKCIDGNHPIPANLLISIRKSLNSLGFSAFPNGSVKPAVGWGSFHLGFSGNADPEPGRCRRTDGKKWRCSRDAVADQKYCERHMNRGRHRSRKPVEGQNGHKAKVTPVVNPSSSSDCGDESSNSFKMANKLKSNLPSSINSFPTQFDRKLVGKEKHNCVRNSQELSVLTSVNPKPTATLIPISKQHITFKESSPKLDYTIISSDLPLNLPRSSYLESTSFISTLDLNNQDPLPHSLRHFTDDWTQNQSNCSTITWPEREELLSNKNQRPINFPLAFTDMSSSSLSLENLTHSPAKLAQKCDSTRVNLGMRSLLNEDSQQQAYRRPISWEASMGGPLGEALNNTSNTSMNRNKKCSSLDLMVDDWDLSPQVATSPTGVLQKTSLASLSSSTASSPMTEKHKAHDSISSLRDDLLCSTL